MHATEGRRSARPLAWLPLIAAALAPAGCGGEAEPAASSASFGHLETLTVEPELRIDGSEHVLVPIRWIGVGGDGSVALMQTQDAALRLFDREGNEMGTVGGRGEGPGDFTRPIRGGWKGDSMWVSDMGLRRVSVLTPEGEFARVVSPPNTVEPAPEDADRLPAFSFITPYALYPGDTMLVSGQWTDGDPLAERMEGQPVLLRVSAEGVIDRVVREVPEARAPSPSPPRASRRLHPSLSSPGPTGPCRPTANASPP